MIRLFRHRRPQRSVGWIALLAACMLALAPTVFHALAWAQGSNPWAQICSAPVAGNVSTPASDDPSPAGASAHFEHCPFCALGGAAALPPCPASAPWVDAGLSQAVPALFLQAPQPLFPWRAAQPRAPPSLV